MTIKTIVYKKNLGGETDAEMPVKFSMLKMEDSLSFLFFMTKLIGMSAGQALGALDGKPLNQLTELKEDDFNLEKIGELFAGFFSKLDDKEFIEKLNLLFKSCECNGEMLEVNHTLFEGDPMLIFKVAKEAIGVNYKRFLDGNSGILSKITKSLNIMRNTKNSQTSQT